MRFAHPGMSFLAFQAGHADREDSIYPSSLRDPTDEVCILSIMAQDLNIVVVLFVDPF